MMSIEGYQDLIYWLLENKHQIDLKAFEDDHHLISHCFMKGVEPDKAAAGIAKKWKEEHE